MTHTQSLHLPHVLREQILAAAQRALPAECCGLIAGVAVAEGWQVSAVHETSNLAPDPIRNFLVDPQNHFELLRTLRGTGRHIVGCFHSHPNGLAVPSERDRVEAIEDGFVWVIASGGSDAFQLNAFVYDAARNAFSLLRLEP